MRILSWALALSAVAALTACGKKIGDECETSADCSADGDRTCDRSQPGGYCTIDGCDQGSCPEDSTCIRFFPGRFVSKPCDAATEDLPEGTDACTADELCLPEGLCAPRASERRFCAATCSGDGDCRGGYRCQQAGTGGSVALGPSASSTARFCAPR